MNENALFVWLFTAPRRARAYSLPCSFILMFVHGLVFANENLQKARQPAAPLRNIQRFAKNHEKSGPPLAARSSGGASTPALVVPRRPPPLAMSSHPARRELPREAHAVLRMNKQGLPRYPEVSGQELKKTFVVRAPKPAENGKAPSTPSLSSSAAASSSADAFETPMSLDATEPRLLALGRRLLPGHGCHFAAWCAVSMRGQGGG